MMPAITLSTNGLRRLFRLVRTCLHEPLPHDRPKAVGFSHVSVACSEGRFEGQSRQVIELGCRLQILGDAVHVFSLAPSDAHPKRKARRKRRADRSMANGCEQIE